MIELSTQLAQDVMAKRKRKFLESRLRASDEEETFHKAFRL